MRPLLPDAEMLRPYLQRIDRARYYSNHGPLVCEFERRLATHFGLGDHQLTTVANGTIALSAAIVATGAKPGSVCLLPSWTFVASAAAVWAAQLTPRFADVSAATWMLDPATIRLRDDLAEIGAVMVVAPFGAPVDTAAWDAFSDETGIAVIVDAAAAFDAATSIATARPGRSAMMISFHATKSFGIGEGAVVMSTDPAVARRIRDICNFGYDDDTAGVLLGYNGKLSEYHAAIGLAALDGWPERRTQLDSQTQRYAAALDGLAGVSAVPGYGSGWVSCYCNIATNDGADRMESHLRDQGIGSRRWWRNGVHVQPAYVQFSHGGLPVTDDLGERVIGLPFFHDLTDEQFERVIGAVARDGAHV